MRIKKRVLAGVLAFALALSLAACGEEETGDSGETEEKESVPVNDSPVSEESDREYIEETLNLANNTEYTWSYQSGSDAWTMSVVSAVAYPEIEDQEGVSVCVPGAYVTGVDTSGDGEANITAERYSQAVNGTLVIDHDAEIVNTNGQVYTADTAPVILNTGAAGYGSSTNTQASAEYAADGYINVACGNRGKQDTVTDADGTTYYTGDAPCCLCDQKAAARFVKYNILLGNLPGSVDHFVSTGGSGGAAHAAMFAATSNNADFYPYQAEVGAVGVYLCEDGTYASTVLIDGEETALSDGAWGCIAYSAITSLYEGDTTMAFEYYLDTDFSFGSSFQEQLAEYLSDEYMEYINGQDLTVEESAVGFDLDGDGALNSTVSLTIEYDPDQYADTSGYGGSYLDLYLAEFISNLQWYLDNLDYASGWTWFGTDGKALSDEEVAAMTNDDKAAAFIEGRYAASASGNGMGGDMPGGGMAGGDMSGGDMPGGDMSGGGMPDGGTQGGDMPGGGTPDGGTPDSGTQGGDTPGGGTQGGDTPDGGTQGGDTPDGGTQGGDIPDGGTQGGGTPDGDMADGGGDMPGNNAGNNAREGDAGGTLPGGNSQGENTAAGRPDETAAYDAGLTVDGLTYDSGSAAGAQVSTLAAGGSDSSSYSTFQEMVEAYRSDIDEIEAGDQFGNNIVALYNPLNYIGAEGTDDPVWTRIVMGAQEGDMSMFASLNLEINWLNAGTDSEIEWQWDGGHVPSEVLSGSFSLYVDQMYAEHAGGVEVETPAAEAQTTNGTATSATGTDLSGWVDYSDIHSVSFSLASAVAYRAKGASKAVPGFDVIDYGQEDYVFGSATKDARHWDVFVLEAFESHGDVLESLFNGG